MLDTNEILILTSLIAVGAWYFLGCPGTMSVIKIFGDLLHQGEKTVKVSEDKNARPLLRLLAKLAVFLIGGSLILLYIFRRSLPRLF